MVQRLLLAAVFSLGMLGCATAATIKAMDAGRLLTFAEPCQDIQTVLLPVLRELGFTLRSEDHVSPCGLTLVVIKPISAFSWGEIVRVIVAPGDAGETLVRVHTERAMATNVTARGDWSMAIHKALIKALEARRAEST